jgi:hypothetical protein
LSTAFSDEKTLERVLVFPEHWRVILGVMQRVAAVAIALGLTGCVTGAGIWKRNTPDGVRLPLLLGAVAGDFVVTGLVASQVQDFTVGASLGTALAITVADFGVGCLIGACGSLRL